MTGRSRRVVRLTLFLVVLGGIFVLANGALLGHGKASTQTTDRTPTNNSSVPYGYSVDLEPRINKSNVDAKPISPDDEITVIATQGFFVSDENAELTAITRSGEVLYHNNSFKVYFDVDPVEGKQWTVEYMASSQLNGESCSEFKTHWCTTNVIEQVNLSTGEVDRIYTNKTPRVTATRSHDADRINDTHIAIADIYKDRVFIYNTRTEEITWQWNATRIYDKDQGGPENDWTHINDVEVLEDGRIMLNVRNMDEVVFIEPGKGVQHNWTLGEDENHSIIYESHNPDYIPRERGGPSVLIGDSENNRVVEYRRTGNATWSQTWLWKDARMQWPRDADRLPNGRTLVVDSHGDRVMELSPNGSIAWKVHVGMPYDVERLGTGDESTGGEAIDRVQANASAGDQTNSLIESGLLAFKEYIPAKWVNGALYMGPGWFRFHDIVTLSVVVLTGLVWGGMEYYWTSWSVSGLARSLWRRLTWRG